MSDSKKLDPINAFLSIHEKSNKRANKKPIIPPVFRSSIGFMGIAFVVAALVQIVGCVLCIYAFRNGGDIVGVASLPGSCLVLLFLWMFAPKQDPQQGLNTLWFVVGVVGPAVSLVLYSFIIAVVARYIFRHRLQEPFQFTLRQLMIFITLCAVTCSVLASLWRWVL